MRRLPIALVALAAMGGATHAQAPAPFDMSPERKPETTMQPAGPATGLSPALQVQTQGSRRFLLPAATLALRGEEATEGWVFRLTPEQAAAGATLELAYRNAVVVAPEMSRLTVFVNDMPVADQALNASEFEQHLALNLPAGVLQPGANSIRFNATQRHRTDCSVDSTYALWTEINAEKTFLSFAVPHIDRMVRLEDIRTMAPGPDGRSRFLIVVPSLGQTQAASTTLRLAQGLSHLSDVPNLSFSFSRTIPEKIEPGETVVIVATTAEMTSLAGGGAPLSRGRMMAGFEPLPTFPDTNALTFVGTGWDDISGIVENFLTLTANAAGEREEQPATGAPLAAAPMIDGARNLSLEELGVASHEFSGRRFSTEFAVRMPADFYAGNYGTMTILLDAAYSSDIRPGSGLNITVNGNLATAMPITSPGGAVLKHEPVRITMRHFRPGLNTIGIEASLITDKDLTCFPGASADRTPRFALFNTSRLVVPDFARLDLAPNLAATAGLGEPYLKDKGTTAVILGSTDKPTLDTAATVLGKLARAAGKPLPITIAPPAGLDVAGNALIFGSATDFPEAVLGGVSLSGSARGSLVGQTAEVDVNAWQNKVESGTLANWFDAANDWLQATFNLNFATVRLLPAGNFSYRLPETAGIFVNQTVDGPGKAVRTLITARDEATLVSGAVALADDLRWSEIRGRTSYLDTADMAVKESPAIDRTLMSLHPANFTNLRLVLANWLSGNYVIYAFGIILAAIALGLSTNILLKRIGRHAGR